MFFSRKDPQLPLPTLNTGTTKYSPVTSIQVRDRMTKRSKMAYGIMPLEIGEIIRRPVWNTLAKVIKENVMMARVSAKFSGLTGACEAATKATYTVYQKVNTEPHN